MAKEKIRVFISTTIEVFILWLQEAVLPLVGSTPAPKEQLEDKSAEEPSDDGYSDLPVDFLDPFVEAGYTTFEIGTEDDEIDGPRVIFATMPWGQIIPIPFSEDDWSMVREISESSGDDIGEVLKSIVNERFETIAEMELPSAPPGELRALFENFFDQIDFDDDGIDSDE